MTHGRKWCLAAAVAAFVVAGCNPTFAPPVRSANYGPPGRLRAGEAEVGGAMTIPFVTGGPYFGLAVLDQLSVEVGGEFAAIAGNEEGESGWGLGWLGLRGTLPYDAGDGFRLAVDLEAGGGLGVGGSLCDNAHHSGDEWDTECPVGEQWDGVNWANRLAGGGYVGLGLGLTWDWFSTYLRTRHQFTKAENIPLTYWYTVSLGVDFLILDRFNIYASYGLAGYQNDYDEEPAWPFLGEIGMALKFDVLAASGE